MDDDIANGILEELSAIRRMMAAYLMYAAAATTIGAEMAEEVRAGGNITDTTDELIAAGSALEERVKDYV